MARTEFTLSTQEGVGRQAAALNDALHATPQAATTPAPITATPVTLMDLAEPEGSPMVPRSLGLRAPGTAQPDERGSLWDAVWQAEGTWSAAKDIFSTHGFDADSKFEIPALDSDEWKDTIGDLPEEYWADLGSAISADHFKALASVARKDAEAERTIAEYGGAGVAGRIAAAMLDPVSLSLGLATGGLGWAAKGTRVVKGLKLAGIAATENAGIEAILAEASPGRDGHDVAYAALSGFVLGGTLGYVLSKDEAIRAVAAGGRQADVQATAEAQAFVGPTRQRFAPPTHHERVADVESAIDDLVAVSRVDDLAAAGDAPAMAVSQVKHNLVLANRHVVETQKAIDDVSVDAIDARMAAEDAANGNVSTPKMRRKAAEVEAKGARQEAHKRLSDAKQGVRKVGSDLARLEKATEARRRLRTTATTAEERIAHIDDPELRDIMRGRLMTARANAAPRTLEEMIAGMKAEQPTGPSAADTFGDDSAGAASTGVGSTDELRPVPEATVEVAETKFRKVRFDLGATLRGSVAGARNLVGRYVGDSVGAKDGAVTELGASEHAARHHEALLGKFHTALTPTYNEWVKATGTSFLGKWSRTSRGEFNALISAAIRDTTGTITNPHALKAASGIRKVFAEVLTEAKAAGVKGFENVSENANYIPRVFNMKRLHGLLEEIGGEGVENLVRGAMRAKVPADVVDDDVLGWLAKGYVKRLREVGMGLDSRTAYGVSLDDTDAVAGLMRGAGATDDQINDVVSRLQAMKAKSATGEGSVRYGKLRFDLDENFAMDVVGNNGARRVRMDELFENDIEHLMGRYLRSMSGHIGMAKIGVKSFDDHKKNLEALASVYEGQPEALRKVHDAADLAYKLVTGQPIENLGEVARWSRFLRDYNFTRTMNQAGFAQIPDLAGLFSTAYMRHTLTHLPELRKMMSRGADGKLKDEFAAELEALLGVGTDYHNVAVFSMFDVEAEGFAGVLGSAEHALRVMGRGTQAMSGMAAITAGAQRLMAKAIVQRFVSGKVPTDRLAALGIDEAMMTRIRAQLDAHTQLVPGDSGRKVKQLNYAGWTDLDARDSFLQAVHKEARRLVQEEDVGDTAKWMHTSTGKLIIQFRRFGIVSYTKQLLNGAAHADAETGSRMLASFALAGAAYWAQQQVRMAGMNDRDKRQWEKKYLSGDRLAAAAFARSSFSSLLPAVSDSISSTLLGVKAFDVRTSGQASGVIEGISSVDAANKFARVTGKAFQVALRDDRQFTESDLSAFKSLMPYGNLIPMQFAFESLVKPGLDLPKKQRDGNSDKVNFSFD